MKVSIDQVNPYVTKDGSVIRELIRPGGEVNAVMSVAEATVQPGGQTFMHVHKQSQEIYHITGGSALMNLGDEEIAVEPGDTVLIPAGMSHNVRNTGSEPLKILCCCCPPYSHEDTVLTGVEE